MSVGARALALAVLLALTMAGPGRPQAGVGGAVAHGDLALGQAIAKRDCGGCHAVDRAGDSPLPQAPRLRELHRRYPVEQLGEALAEGIVVGHGPMPEWVLESREIEALIVYLKSLESDAPSPPSRP